MELINKLTNPLTKDSHETFVRKVSDNFIEVEEKLKSLPLTFIGEEDVDAKITERLSEFTTNGFTRIEKLTQETYDEYVSNDTVDPNCLYLITE